MYNKFKESKLRKDSLKVETNLFLSYLRNENNITLYILYEIKIKHFFIQHSATSK